MYGQTESGLGIRDTMMGLNMFAEEFSTGQANAKRRLALDRATGAGAIVDSLDYFDFAPEWLHTAAVFEEVNITRGFDPNKTTTSTTTTTTTTTTSLTMEDEWLVGDPVGFYRGAGKRLLGALNSLALQSLFVQAPDMKRELVAARENSLGLYPLPIRQNGLGEGQAAAELRAAFDDPANAVRPTAVRLPHPAAEMEIASGSRLEEAINRPKNDWQDQIHREILRGLRNISETP